MRRVITTICAAVLWLIFAVPFALSRTIRRWRGGGTASGHIAAEHD